MPSKLTPNEKMLKGFVEFKQKYPDVYQTNATCKDARKVPHQMRKAIKESDNGSLKSYVIAKMFAEQKQVPDFYALPGLTNNDKKTLDKIIQQMPPESMPELVHNYLTNKEENQPSFAFPQALEGALIDADGDFGKLKKRKVVTAESAKKKTKNKENKAPTPTNEIPFDIIPEKELLLSAEASKVRILKKLNEAYLKFKGEKDEDGNDVVVGDGDRDAFIDTCRSHISNIKACTNENFDHRYSIAFHILDNMKNEGGTHFPQQIDEGLLRDILVNGKECVLTDAPNNKAYYQLSGYKV